MGRMHFGEAVSVTIAAIGERLKWRSHTEWQIRHKKLFPLSFSVLNKP